MIYLKISYMFVVLFMMNGCTPSKYDYTIHKPKVLYKPSLAALDRINRGNIGKKYVWAEEGPWCYDCSGLTYFTYGTMGIEIPRVAREQFKKGIPIKRSELKKGDLVFFDTRKHYRGSVNHVGIYIGDNKFMHASSAKKRVVITSLDKPFYKRRYLGARRYYNFNTPFLRPSSFQQYYVQSKKQEYYNQDYHSGQKEYYNEPKQPYEDSASEVEYESRETPNPDAIAELYGYETNGGEY